MRTIIISEYRNAQTLACVAVGWLFLAWSPAPAAHVYSISIDDELRLMTVEARYEHAINYIAARSHSARQFLDDAQNCDTGERLKSRYRTLQLPPEGLKCLSYTVNLRGAARIARLSEIFDRSNVVVSPTLWMWRPPLDRNEEISVEFHLPDGMRVFVPWQATNDEHTHYRLTASPESGSAIAAFGSFERVVEQVADSDLTLVLLATRDSRELAALARGRRGRGTPPGGYCR